VANGGVFTMRSKLVMPQIYLALLLLPAAYISLAQVNLQFLSALILVYWLYLVGFLLRSHKQYQYNYRFQLNLTKNSQAIGLKDKIDSLTKIYNRHYFEDCFEYQWQLAMRNGTDIALLMIDIDDFKRINDDYGKDYGDQCLVHIADVIRQSAKRQTDMVVRYAGEQFVLILPDTEQAAALNLARVICRNLEFEEFQFAGENHTVTASIGVGVVQPKQFSSPTILLQKAEMALFQAKTHGRNRVELG
jgi:diguanylate cyclase (GGDEF)-like protein